MDPAHECYANAAVNRTSLRGRNLDICQAQVATQAMAAVYQQGLFTARERPCASASVRPTLILAPTQQAWTSANRPRCGYGPAGLIG